jgi:hypothetical protein
MVEPDAGDPEGVFAPDGAMPSGANPSPQGLCLEAVWYSQKPGIRLPRHQPPRRSH